MAKVDADVAVFMNPAVYSQAKNENKKKAGKTGFSRIFDAMQAEKAGELGPLKDLPVSEETISLLMDEVHNAGDNLRNRPFPDEILRYKQAVRNFMHFIVEHAYGLGHEAGIPNFLKPGYKGPRGTPEAMKQKGYTKIQVIDKKLEELAAALLSGQTRQLEIVSRLEEIKGLLIDLMQ
jgi:uncharacterized protein YaaR (DUF327 family)